MNTIIVGTLDLSKCNENSNQPGLPQYSDCRHPYINILYNTYIHTFALDERLLADGRTGYRSSMNR